MHEPKGLNVPKIKLHGRAVPACLPGGPIKRRVDVVQQKFNLLDTFQLVNKLKQEVRDISLQAGNRQPLRHQHRGNMIKNDCVQRCWNRGWADGCVVGLGGTEGAQSGGGGDRYPTAYVW
ncbi:hypothetical protein QC761_0104050 [Podospora bellae-mahoneyi]|uniref:Uncharacterized protein n=1 Tax=Podospora bellae-mahoneyi TaxID=2093777 RepID=A0ABR0F7M5_9PEZI|nr:hypothetical protein QC761_0104050 [Podospora bellae-mahoneyi]